METNLNRIINQSDISRYVVKQMCGVDQQSNAGASPRKATGATSVTPQQVSSLFRAVGNFINFMFRKTQFDCLVADIYGLGQAVHTCTNNTSTFVPSNMLQQECRLSKVPLLKVIEPAQRQELSLAKMASMIQLSESVTGQIMHNICKAIGFYLRQERRTVVLDFGGLNSNEVVCFENETVTMIDKKHLREALIFDSTSNGSQQQPGVSIFDRMGAVRASCRLAPQYMQKLVTGLDKPVEGSINGKSRVSGTEFRSVNSTKRSLTIQSKNNTRAENLTLTRGTLVNQYSSNVNSPNASPMRSAPPSAAAGADNTAPQTEQKQQQYQEALQHFLGSKMSQQQQSPRNSAIQQAKTVDAASEALSRNSAKRNVFSSHSGVRSVRLHDKKELDNVQQAPEFTTDMNPTPGRGGNPIAVKEQKSGLDNVQIKSSFGSPNAGFQYKPPNTADADQQTRPSKHGPASVRSSKVGSAAQDMFATPKAPESYNIALSPVSRQQIVYTPQERREQSEMPGMLEKSLPHFETLKKEEKLSLKERLERQKQMTLNNEVFSQTQPFGKFITYSTPANVKRLNPEIQLLMDANQTMRCLGAGTSHLGQEAMKVLRYQNQNRHQLNQGDTNNYNELEKFKTLQMQRRQRMIEDLAQHRVQIQAAEDKRRSTQKEFGRYWRMQMDWNANTRQEAAKIEKADPDTVWTIEGPTRRAQEKIIKDQRRLDLKHTLAQQQEHFRTTQQTEKQLDLSEGQRLQERDQQMKENEDQMHAFKKQVFAQEMRRTWEQQKAYKKSLQHIEDLY